MSVPAVLGPNCPTSPLPIVEIEDDEPLPPHPHPLAVTADPSLVLEPLPVELSLPPLPPNVLELIISFKAAPERFKGVCKKFRDEVSPHALSLQLTRLQQSQAAVDALNLAEISDLFSFSEKDFVAVGEDLHKYFVDKLATFFSLTTPMPRSRIFQLIADPEKLAKAINAAYLSSIIDVLFKVSSGDRPFSEAGAYAARLLEEKDPSIAVENAFQWASEVQELHNVDSSISFSAELSEDLFAINPPIFLPKAFLKTLSPKSIGPVGSVNLPFELGVEDSESEIEDSDEEEPATLPSLG